MGVVPADVTVEVGAPPRPPRRALRLAFAATVGVATTLGVIVSLVVQEPSHTLRVEPPPAMSPAAVTDALTMACTRASAAQVVPDLVVDTAAAYEVETKHRLGALTDAASALATVVPGPSDEARVTAVEQALAAAASQARTALALAQAGDATGSHRALDAGATRLATACR